VWGFTCLGLIYCISSCVEPFQSPNTGNDRFLVVDGLITDEPIAHEVILSRSIRLDTLFFDPETGAQVEIEREDGQVFPLVEGEPGHYFTDSTQFQPQVGDRFRLRIQAGNEYLSEYVTLKPVSGIDSISFTEIQQASVDGDNGLEFRVTTNPTPGSEEVFNRFDYNYTYEINTPYISIWKYSPALDTIVPREFDEIYSRCWTSVDGTTINVASSEEVSTNRIVNYPILYVPYSGFELTRRFSLEVSQYALSQSGYSYFNTLMKLNESQGTFFDLQPGQLRSNIESLSNSDEIVLGYFDASQRASKRIFVNRSQLPPNTITGQIFCNQPINTLYNAPPGQPRTSNYYSSHLVIDPIFNLMGGLIGWSFHVEGCADCRVYGSEIRPSFWE